MRVLLVEDDDAFAEGLTRGLRLEGFSVRRAATASQALDGGSLEAGEADIVLLDAGLPDLDGFEVCRRIRARSTVPIVLVTARSDEEERVAGFECGADDYVVKPFGLRELVARMRAVTRRAGREFPATVRIGSLEVDARTRRAMLAGSELDLTPLEFKVLALLASDSESVFERQDILERVWGHAWYGPTKTLDVHVASLRRKLGDPSWVQAVRGVGFRLVPVP
ncbi:MAG TPA: response regulator transcription factor [Acidimicrobiia bacterium]|nr:response regulator transcription factor [Acidimicrobiia bacterium]